MHEHSGCIDADELSEDSQQRLAHLVLLRDRMTEMLGGFDEKEQKILEKRFGLNENVFYSLQDLEEEFGVSPDYVLELECRMLEKIGEPAGT